MNSFRRAEDADNLADVVSFGHFYILLKMKLYEYKLHEFYRGHILRSFDNAIGKIKKPHGNPSHI
jgi:hypothetical protein